MHVEMMTLLSMQGRSWQSPTPKQQLPRTQTMMKLCAHKIVSRMRMKMNKRRQKKKKRKKLEEKNLKKEKTFIVFFHGSVACVGGL